MSHRHLFQLPQDMDLDRPTLAKIVATIGPASESPEMVRKLIEAGVSVFRFNFSHGEFGAHEKRLRTVREVAGAMGRTVACLGDLQGPKIRVGKVPPGLSKGADGTPLPGIELKAGQDVILKKGISESFIRSSDNGEGTPVLSLTYEKMVDEVAPGQRVLINDGAIRMLAVDTDHAKGELRCRVRTGGLVTSNKGINLPQSEISAPAITDRDWECVAWAVKNGIDFLALSFVRKADEVLELKRRLAELCPIDKALDPSGQGVAIPVIAKIEKPQAVQNIESIVDASDAIMVARGDLGVEMDIAQVPIAQKVILDACGQYGKPVIVATQMLESMIESPVPTRAEASDVANAIFDSADAVMLSGETAVGKNPSLVVETMRRIIAAAESRIAELPRRPGAPLKLVQSRYATAALAHGAWQIAHDIGAKAIVCWSENAGTARYLSQNNFTVPIFAWSSNLHATRRMALLAGVTPVHAPPPASGTLAEWNSQVDAYLVERRICRPGDSIILVAGKPLGVARVTNALAIHIVGETRSGFRAH
jgi:pyruvate kinase